MAAAEDFAEEGRSGVRLCLSAAADDFAEEGRSGVRLCLSAAAEDFAEEGRSGDRVCLSAATEDFAEEGHSKVLVDPSARRLSDDVMEPISTGTEVGLSALMLVFESLPFC